MQVEQEDQKNQAGDKEEKKSETEEMEVNDTMDGLITKNGDSDITGLWSGI